MMLPASESALLPRDTFYSSMRNRRRDLSRAARTDSSLLLQVSTAMSSGIQGLRQQGDLPVVVAEPGAGSANADMAPAITEHSPRYRRASSLACLDQRRT